MPSRPAAWSIGPDRRLRLDRPLVMGILNVTPDSFSDGGLHLSRDAALAHARHLLTSGADIVDVGGESTRPGADSVDEAEELRRVIPVVSALVSEGVVVSVDTSKPAVAAVALDAGAHIVNDVTGLVDPEMRKIVAGAGCGVIVMHMQGDPRTMQTDPRYDDVVAEVTSALLRRAQEARAEGISPSAIALDPGIGFGKTVDHNLTLLRDLAVLASTGHPIVVGTSRKSFLGRITGVEDPSRRDTATAVSIALAVERGASVVRVHEPSSAKEAVQVAEAIVRGQQRTT